MPVRTIKFKVAVLEGNEENKCLSKKESWELINKVSDAVYKGANLLSASIFSMEQMIYNTVSRTVGYAGMTSPQKSALFKKAKEDYCNLVLGGNQSPQALLDQYMKINLPFLPPNSSASLTQQLIGKLTSSTKSLGSKRMPSFRKGYPIPFTTQQFFIFKGLDENNKDSYYAKYSVMGMGRNNKSILFKFILGKNAFMSGLDKELEKIIKTEWKNGKYGFTSGNLVNGDDLMVSFTVDSEVKENKLDDTKAVGVDIGMKIPAVVSLNTTGWSQSFGDGFVLKQKLSHRGQQAKLKRNLSLNQGGHGYSQKMEKLEEYKSYEANFTKNYTFKIASEIIKFTLKNKAGIIKMEFLESLAQEKKLNGLFPYGMLQTRVEQLAEKNGIKVVYVDPYHTSQECSCCGTLGERLEQAIFTCNNPECEKFGKPQNADRNASLNIAKSTKVVDKKEDCMYYKIKKGEIKNK